MFLLGRQCSRCFSFYDSSSFTPLPTAAPKDYLRCARNLRSRVPHVRLDEDDVPDRFDIFGAEALSLFSSPNLASTAWAAATLSCESTPTKPTPPSPYSRCPWPRFLALMPQPESEAFIALAGSVAADVSACVCFLSTRRGRRVTGAGALWPIHDTVRDLLVQPQATLRRFSREITSTRPILPLSKKFLSGSWVSDY
jgi:hypothetical protein